MNESAQKLNAVVAALLIIASVFGIALMERSKTGTPRPAETASGKSQVFGSQTIPSRLWQDPFEAFAAYTNSAAGAACVSTGRSWQGVMAQREVTSSMAVLAVMLEGAPYPEDKETRRRLRYAVEMALLTSGFAPNDRQHIGVQVLDFEKADSPTRTQEIAFEWFSPIGGGTNDLLLLWIREEDFASVPLERLGWVWQQLSKEYPGSASNSSFYIIGPRSSDTLRTMAKEAFPTAFAEMPKGRFRILSPHATAPDPELFPEEKERVTNSLDRAWLKARLRGGCEVESNEVFQTWIATDDQLSERIVEELSNRPIRSRFGTGRDVIVLVSEADTFYGRSLPKAFKEALMRREFPIGKNNIWSFNYLRGLEGIKAEKKADEEREAKTPISPEAVFEAALKRRGESAEGESQQDYAKRLADFLVGQQSRSRRDGLRIRAVGLTGSDLYDKLVLLQALRPRLPEVLFFTTDLDARLWSDPKLLVWTRNLLVASSYGLAPRLGDDPWESLPFRDVYQASTFAACRGACRMLAGSTNGPGEDNLRGSVYEIGRHGPVALTPAGGPKGLTGWLAALESRAPSWRWGLYLSVFCSVVVITALYTLLLSRANLQRTPAGASADSTTSFVRAGVSGQANPSKRSGDETTTVVTTRLGRKDPWDNPWTPILAAATAALVCIAAMAIAESVASVNGEEPWVFRAGVSIWPTEMIRLMAMLLSATLLWLAWRQEKSHCLSLARRFITSEEIDSIDKVPAVAALFKGDCPFQISWYRILKRCARRVRDWRRSAISNWTVPYTTNRLGQTAVDAEQLFAGYVWRGRTARRYRRSLANSFMFVAASVSVFLLFKDMPSAANVRGPASRVFDVVTLISAVMGFLCVLFYALDATRLSYRLLILLSREKTLWPDWLTKRRAEKYCLDVADVDPLIDMEFSVEHTRQVSRLMLYPFIILLLLLVSRSSFFDNWTWHPILVGVFVVDFLLAAACWAVLRGSAREVRTRALNELSRRASYFEHVWLPEVRTPGPRDSKHTARGEETVCVYSPTAYAQRLRDVHDDIQKESGGAFAHWVQDPTYLFLFVPTGITGIITVAIHYLIS